MNAIVTTIAEPVTMTSQRRALTADEVVWKDNLKDIYKKKKRDLGLTQEKLADLCGWKTQAAVSNYMNGVIPLNTDAKIKFAKVLEVEVTEIDPKMSSAGSNTQAPTTASEFFELYGDYLDGLPMKELMRVVGRVEAIVDKHLALARENKD